MSSFPDNGKIKVAVVTGQHPFHLPGFHALFRSLPEVDFYSQHLEDFVTDVAGVRDEYDTVVFYNHHQTTPGTEGDWWDRATQHSFERFGTTSQGIFILHHGMSAFRQWPFWSELCGIEDRRLEFTMDQTVEVQIADPSHPITSGLPAWEMVDETYLMPSAGDGSHILLTTEHPRSMKTLAWTRQHGSARVFCLQPGHGPGAFEHPTFRTIVGRGIGWTAGRV
ncbi:MAG: ThuA domain-containing protein [Armatimonadota bacterium]|nr:ThuA domain-containing protein [Armatimonadota bacterium]